MAKVAFIGLGVMGYPMAGHLAMAGHRVTVYNRTMARAAKWVKEFEQAGKGGHVAAHTPKAAAESAKIVLMCVGADRDIRDVVFGDQGVLAGMKAGAVLVDHTTASAAIARELHEKAGEKEIGFLDAPVSGGEAGAVNGQLTVMIGGGEAPFKKARPVIKTYAKMMKLLGPAGSGQTAKMVNQICIAGIVQGLSEALHFALEAGMDANAVVDVISKGAAQSWQMENRASTMIDDKFDFGFAVDWMRKDLAIVLAEARRLGVSLPLTALVDQFYNDVQKMGGSRQDTSSLIRRFRE